MPPLPRRWFTKYLPARVRPTSGSERSSGGGGAGVPQNGQNCPGVSTSRLHLVQTKAISEAPLDPGDYSTRALPARRRSRRAEGAHGRCGRPDPSRPEHHPVQRIARLADGRDADGRLLADGAAVLADPAPHAADRVDLGPLQRDRGPVRPSLLGAHEEDGLRIGRAHLLADDARDLARPRQAPAAVEEGGTDPDGRLPVVSGLPRGGERQDGARRADLAAAGAGELAAAAPRDDDRRPEALHAGDGERGLDGRGRAGAPAEHALHAAIEEPRLVDGPGRTDEPGVRVAAAAAGGAQER